MKSEKYYLGFLYGEFGRERMNGVENLTISAQVNKNFPFNPV